MAISPQRLTIYLYSAHRAVIFAIAQLSCLTHGVYYSPTALTVALMLQCCVCLSVVVRLSSVTLCIVAKGCVLEQKLLLKAYI